MSEKEQKTKKKKMNIDIYLENLFDIMNFCHQIKKDLLRFMYA